MENPYQSPSANVAAPIRRDRNDRRMDDVAYGQKKVIYAILLYFAAAFGVRLVGPLALLAILICIPLAWAGIYQMGRGLGYPVWLCIILLFTMLIPLVGLLVLIALSSRATNRLKEAGYKVGLLGASNY